MRAEFPPFAVLQHRFRGLEGLAGTGEEGVPCRNVLTDRPFKFPILYGRWSVARAGSKANSTRTLRLALRTDAVGALLWSVTDVHVLDDAGLAAHPYLRKLGPDVLEPTTTVDLVLARLDEARFRRRSLAALYLDQGFLAGIGNYLRTEVLWYAAVDPAARPVDLGSAARERLAAATVHICQRAYATGGRDERPRRRRCG